MLISGLFIFFLICLFLGLPVAFGIGLSAVIGIIISDISIISIAIRMFTGVDSYPFLAIPFFICAGNIMNSTGITRRLINLSDSFVGSVRSSLGQINILTSIFFAGISGSDVADATAIGSTLIPIMKEKNYTSEEAAVITGTSSIIGPIIPPSIRMIVYGSLTGTSILGLFLAGILPGLALGFSLMFVTYILSLRRINSMGNLSEARTKFSLKKAIIAIKENLYLIPIPIIVVGGIYSGFFTVTEAGVVLLFYTFLIGKYIYKSLSLNELKKILINSALTTALVGFIIATATAFSYLLSVEGFAPWFISITVPFQSNPNIFIVLIISVLFILGCLVPITAVLIIFAPFFPMMQNISGLHPLHFGLLIILVLGLGSITPPYGTVLYIVAYIAKTSVIKSLPTLIPYLIVMIILVLLLVLVPWFSLYIPQLLGF